MDHPSWYIPELLMNFTCLQCYLRQAKLIMDKSGSSKNSDRNHPSKHSLLLSHTVFSPGHFFFDVVSGKSYQRKMWPGYVRLFSKSILHSRKIFLHPFIMD